jgi:hypothetical protein
MLGSTTLVAVTVTDCVLVTDAGAVYRPVDVRLPTLGFSVHVTAVLLVPVTVAKNCCACPGATWLLPGLTEIVIGGLRVTLAVACLVESAALVAVMVTSCRADTLFGAV